MLSMINLKRNKSLIIGSFLMLCGISMFIYSNINNKLHEKQQLNLVEEFFINEEEVMILPNEEVIKETKIKDATENYIAVIEIKKINLKSILVDQKSKQNNVNKHIQIMGSSTMPNVANGTLILAGHSGNGWNAYFKNLIKLKLDDIVTIYYGGMKYNYSVIKIYNQKKNGQIKLNYNHTETNLILTTCHSYDKNKQLIVITKLINKETY